MQWVDHNNDLVHFARVFDVTTWKWVYFLIKYSYWKSDFVYSFGVVGRLVRWVANTRPPLTDWYWEVKGQQRLTYNSFNKHRTELQIACNATKILLWQPVAHYFHLSCRMDRHGGVMVNWCSNTIQINVYFYFIFIRSCVFFCAVCRVRNLCPFGYVLSSLSFSLFTSDHSAPLEWWNVFVFKLAYESSVMLSALPPSGNFK